MKKRLLKLLTVASLSIIPVNLGICDVYAMTESTDNSKKSINGFKLEEWRYSLYNIPADELQDALRLVKDLFEFLKRPSNLGPDACYFPSWPVVPFINIYYDVFDGKNNDNVFENIRRLVFDIGTQMLKKENDSKRISNDDLLEVLISIYRYDSHKWNIKDPNFLSLNNNSVQSSNNTLIGLLDKGLQRKDFIYLLKNVTNDKSDLHKVLANKLGDEYANYICRTAFTKGMDHCLSDEENVLPNRVDWVNKFVDDYKRRYVFPKDIAYKTLNKPGKLTNEELERYIDKCIDNQKKNK